MSSSGWVGPVAAVTAALLAVVGASTVAGWMAPDAALEAREVALPTTTSDRPATSVADPESGPSESTSVAAPGATVMCSNFSEQRIDRARLDGAEVGGIVEVHGGPCVVTEIDAELGTDYPRGVARGNRPGVGPGR